MLLIKGAFGTGNISHFRECNYGNVRFLYLVCSLRKYFHVNCISGNKNWSIFILIPYENIRFPWKRNVSTKVKKTKLLLLLTTITTSLPPPLVIDCWTATTTAILLGVYLKKYIIFLRMWVLIKYKNGSFLSTIYKIFENSVCISNTHKMYVWK